MVKFNIRFAYHNHLCWVDTNFNPMGKSTSNIVLVTLKGMFSSISRTKAPNNLLKGGNTNVSNTIFFTKSLIIPNIQPTSMFHLMITLCEDGGTPRMVIMLNTNSIMTVVPHSIFEVNKTKVSKIQSWHVVIIKLLHAILPRLTKSTYQR